MDPVAAMGWALYIRPCNNVLNLHRPTYSPNITHKAWHGRKVIEITQGQLIPGMLIELSNNQAIFSRRSRKIFCSCSVCFLVLFPMHLVLIKNFIVWEVGVPFNKQTYFHKERLAGRAIMLHAQSPIAWAKSMNNYHIHYYLLRRLRCS